MQSDYLSDLEADAMETPPRIEKGMIVVIYDISISYPAKMRIELGQGRVLGLTKDKGCYLADIEIWTKKGVSVETYPEERLERITFRNDALKKWLLKRVIKREN